MTPSKLKLDLDGILFDNDGTLVDSGPLIAESMHYAVITVLHEDIADEELLSLVGQPLRTQMEVISPEHAEELLVTYRAHNHMTHDCGLKGFANTDHALRELSDMGLLLGVVTSKTHWLCEHGLYILGLRSYFTTVVGLEDSEKHKPDGEPLLVGARKMGVEPSRCMYVGDSPFDLQAARSAGMICAAALWGMFPEDKMRAEKPDFVLNDIEDLVTILQEARG